RARARREAAARAPSPPASEQPGPQPPFQCRGAKPMKRSLPLLPLLLLVACSQNAPADAEGADAAGPRAATADAGPSEAAQAAAASAAAADGAQLPAGETAATDAAPAATPAETPTNDAPVAADGLVEGVDYEVIPGGQPYEPLNGKVEVVE